MNILAIKHVTSKVGRPLILVTTAAKDFWLTPKQWNSKGASAALDSYVGGNIDVDYYKEGDTLINGTDKCTKDETLVKDFYVSANSAVLANAFALESSAKMQKSMDMGALFARKKAESAPKAEAVKEEVAEEVNSATPLN